MMPNPAGQAPIADLCPAMNLLSADAVGLSIADRWLFRNLTFGLNQGQRVALVGANGTGKTSLLNVLAGALPPDEGQVSARRGARIGYLGQNPQLDNTQTIRELLFGTGNAALTAIRDYEEALENGADDATIQRLSELIDELGAWETEVRVHQILSRLGVGQLERVVGTLSGGQRKRVALAQVLIDEPDVLLLDEPTNHLDLATIEWLENILATQATTLLMVTHDRYFLDRVATEVAELQNGELFTYKGNYAVYVEQKAMREEQQATEVEKARNLYRKELDWMRRQPQARGTKQKARIDSFYVTEKKAKTQLGTQGLELSVKTTRQGNKILEADHLRKTYAGGAQPVVADFSYVFRRGERLGIVGPNGAGKTSLLNMLTSRMAPDSGTLEVGQTTVFGYYTQHELTYSDDQRVLDVVKEIAEVITMADGSVITAAQLLTLFQFAPARQYTFVSKLSGGEKRRLQLLRVLMANPNFLVLDEPTNDLDIPTLNVLEDFLINFPGCLLIVSHDRYFMDRLVEQLLVFEGDGQIRSFPGNYTDFREAEKDAAREASVPKETTKHVLAAAPVVMAAPAPATPAKRRATFAEKKEYEGLESEIAQLEGRKAKLEAELTGGTITDHTRLHALGADIQTLTDQISAKEARWLELSELG